MPVPLTNRQDAGQPGVTLGSLGCFDILELAVASPKPRAFRNLCELSFYGKCLK